jgi:serine protease Do
VIRRVPGFREAARDARRNSIVSVVKRCFIPGNARRRLLLAAVVFAILWGGGAAPAQTTSTPLAALARPVSAEKRAELVRILRENAPVLEAQSAVVRAVAALIGPTVVYIEADVPNQTLQYARERHVEEDGSGVIIQWKGKYYVLTNRHVVRDAPPSAVRIHLADGRQLHPLRILDDAGMDIAVLAIEAADLVAAPVGDSDRMAIGDFVLAVGSPFGLRDSVTFGIISAKGRRDLPFAEEAFRYQEFLQTDARINPGSSGGPLCNLRGEIVGINTAIATKSGASEGVGFSIPINMYMAIARQLIESGKVVRGLLGVNLDKTKMGPALAAEIGLPSPMGARIDSVMKDSPAEAAHLQAGDVILEVNGTRVEDDLHLINLVSVIEVGKTVPCLIFRDGKTFTVSVGVADRSKFDAAQPQPQQQP